MHHTWCACFPASPDQTNGSSVFPGENKPASCNLNACLFTVWKNLDDFAEFKGKNVLVGFLVGAQSLELELETTGSIMGTGYKGGVNQPYFSDSTTRVAPLDQARRAELKSALKVNVL